MAQIVTRGKRHFAVGLHWHIAQDKADARRMLKEEGGGGMRVSLQSDGDDRIWFGMSTRLAHEAYAAAAMAAAVFPNVIAAIPLGDGNVWLCATSDGMPLPTKDVICDEQGWWAELHDWMSLFPSATIYGEVNGALGSAEEFWQELERAIEGDSLLTAKQLRQMKLKRTFTPADVAKGLAALSLAAGMAFGAWHLAQLLTKVEVVPEVIKQAPVFDNSQQKEEERRKQLESAIAAHHGQAIAMHQGLRSALSQSPEPWIAFAMKLPAYSNGYKPERVSCEQQGCVLTWTAKNPRFVRETDKFELPGIDRQSIAGGSGTTPTSRFDVAQAQINRSVAYQDLDNLDNALLRARLQDEFKVAGVSVTIEPVQDVVVAGVIEAGLPDRIVAKTANIRMVFTGINGEKLLNKFINDLGSYPFAIDRYATAGTGMNSTTELGVRMILLSNQPAEYERTEWFGDPAQPQVVFRQ